MPVFTRGSGGGGAKKSLILPDNATISLINDVDNITVNISGLGNTEIEIKELNVYLLQTDTKPNSIKEMKKIATLSPDTKSYTIEGLDSGLTYYVAVESVSVEGYENASMRKIKSAFTRNGLFFAIQYTKYFGENHYYSEDGKAWKKIPFDLPSCSDNVLTVNGKCHIMADNGDIYYLDWEKKQYKSISFYSGDYDGAECLVYTGDRLVASYNKGIAIRYWYMMYNPNATYEWVSLGGGPYSFTLIGHNNIMLIAPKYTKYWGVCEIGVTSGWDYYGTSSSNKYGTACAFGNGRFVFAGRDNLSVYVLEKNIKTNNYVTIPSVPSDETYPDWVDVIYAESAGRFVGMFSDGQAYYSETGTRWTKFGNKITPGKLTYGNGRYICAGDGQKSYYSVDGENWIAMSGISETGSYGVCSIYE